MNVILLPEPKTICAKCRWAQPPQEAKLRAANRPVIFRDYEWTCAQPNLQPTKLPNRTDPVTGEPIEHFVFEPLCRDLNTGNCEHYEPQTKVSVGSV